MWDEEGGSGMRDGAVSDPSFPCPSWRRLSLDDQRSGTKGPQWTKIDCILETSFLMEATMLQRLIVK